MKITIYDVLRLLISQASWADGTVGDVAAHARCRAALRLIDRLEELNLLGQIAIDVREEL